ncbi:MAG: IS110 family transposase [Nitrospinae bacterium]|nr:IS110 family transposase [Nitrospinota bacterium]
MEVTTVGIDLAKEVFQVHGVDGFGKVVLRKQLKRSHMSAFFALLPPCLIGMEACGGSHYWGRVLQGYGHEVKLMAPQYVKPYVKTNKNDQRDAEAICEALTRPTMRFVPLKTEEQQGVLSLHRMREGVKKMRAAQSNQIRGLLSEFGIVIPEGLRNVLKRVPLILDEYSSELPASFLTGLSNSFALLKELDKQEKSFQKEILLYAKRDERCKRLETIPGIGPLTASAVIATIGSAKEFKNGRQLSAWLGLVPRQHSTGGKTVLGKISKRGDGYLRTLLVHGARSVITHIEKKKLKKDEQLKELIKRSNKNVATVALANRNVRIIWALLVHGKEYQENYEETRNYAKA